MAQLRECSGKHQGKAYPLVVREAALRDYLSGMRRSAVCEKYNLADPTVLSHWKRTFARSETINSAVKVVKRRNKRLLMTDLESEKEKRIKELERALSNAQAQLHERDSELKKTRLELRIAQVTIDIAEESFNLDIRKKFGSK